MTEGCSGLQTMAGTPLPLPFYNSSCTRVYFEPKLIAISSKYGNAENIPDPLLKSVDKHAPEDHLNFLSAFKLMNVGDI